MGSGGGPPPRGDPRDHTRATSVPELRGTRGIRDALDAGGRGRGVLVSGHARRFFCAQRLEGLGALRAASALAGAGGSGQRRWQRQRGTPGSVAASPSATTAAAAITHSGAGAGTCGCRGAGAAATAARRGHAGARLAADHDVRDEEIPVCRGRAKEHPLPAAAWCTASTSQRQRAEPAAKWGGSGEQGSRQRQLHVHAAAVLSGRPQAKGALPLAVRVLARREAGSPERPCRPAASRHWARRCRREKQLSGAGHRTVRQFLPGQHASQRAGGGVREARGRQSTRRRREAKVPEGCGACKAAGGAAAAGKAGA
mmetsp:Transcript_41443/g.130478  ORF Transcript_41443/g.130478 Transcript_41443/m.130478 type:complete len:313 (-) Transcript_41443:78-1016(-)